jgi:siroheme synthase-like protein
MLTHPVFLCLEGRRCVIVGGDAAAEARTDAALRAGATVTVVAAELSPSLAALAAARRIRHVARDYRPGDLRDAFLAYATVRDPEIVGRLVAEAEEARVLLNVMDEPDACSFVSPAIVARGGLTIAIGTGGASPGLAAALRRDLEVRFGPEYAPFVAILGAVRGQLAGRPGRGDVIAALVASPLLDLVRAREREQIDRLLARVAGEDCTLARLGVTLEEAA